eukprot:5445267-Prymnesium_polylepis.1
MLPPDPLPCARRPPRWPTAHAAQALARASLPLSAGTYCSPGPLVSSSGLPVIRSHMAITSLMAVSKWLVGSKDSEMKTPSSFPSFAGAYMSARAHTGPRHSAGAGHGWRSEPRALRKARGVGA